MKAFFALLVLGAAAFAQAPDPASIAPKAALATPSALKEQAPEKYSVKFVTTKGDFVIEVTRKWAPLGADRFYNLVKNNYFTNAHFFRVIPNFIVQFGMNADPKINRVWERANIPDDKVTQSNVLGTIVFATAGKNTRTTQLFINLGDNSESLNPQGFAPFGKVTQGLNIVQKLYGGYGDSPSMGTGGKGPEQGRISAEGKPYLDKNFPQLDSIKYAVIQEGDAAAKK
jgi:peptidyl-prolyl cis-trans isomerase A (cyclophilin A)